MQPLETHLAIHPVRLAESSACAVAYIKALVQPFEMSHIVLETKNHPSIPCLYLSFFLSVLRKFTLLFQHAFVKSSRYHYSPCFPYFWGVCVLPLHRVLLTCRYVMLSLMRNQFYRHDYKARVCALYTSYFTVLPHRPPQSICIYCNLYHILYKIAVFLTKRITSMVLSVLTVLRLSMSKFLCAVGLL